MAVIQEFFGLLKCEAPPQNCIDTMMVKSLTDDHVVFCLVSNISLFRARDIRILLIVLIPLALNNEIFDTKQKTT